MADTNNVGELACHPLRPVCVFLNMVSAYLYRKDFMNKLLAPPVIPENTEIRFLKAVYEDKLITSDPFVTYKCDGYSIGRTPYGILNAPAYNPSKMNSSMTFTVSTNSDILTEGLAFEIGTYCDAIKEIMKPEGMWIGQIDITETTQDPKSPFFIAKTKVGFSLGLQVWNTTELEGILREVRIKVNPE